MADERDAILTADALRTFASEATTFMDRLDEFSHAHGWVDGEWFRDEPKAQPLDDRDALHRAACTLLPLLERFRKELTRAAHRAESDAIRERKTGGRS